MSEVFIDYDTLREEAKQRRADNTKQSTEVLRSRGVKFEAKNNGVHLIIGKFDFWPSTGLFIDRLTKKRGRGVFRLLKLVQPCQ